MVLTKWESTAWTMSEICVITCHPDWLKQSDDVTDTQAGYKIPAENIITLKEDTQTHRMTQLRSPFREPDYNCITERLSLPNLYGLSRVIFWGHWERRLPYRLPQLFSTKWTLSVGCHYYSSSKKCRESESGPLMGTMTTFYALIFH